MADAYLGQIMSVGFNYAPIGWSTCEGQQVSVSQNQALFALIGNIYGGDGVNNFKLPDSRSRRMIGAYTQQGTPLVTNGAPPTTSSYQLGQVGGAMATAVQTPSHNHTATATTSGVPTTATIPSVGVTVPIQNAPLTLNVAVPASLDPATSDKPLANGMVADASAGGVYCGPSTNTVQLAPMKVQANTAKASLSASPSISVPITAGPITVQPFGAGNGTLPIQPPYIAITTIICVQGLFPSRG